MGRGTLLLYRIPQSVVAVARGRAARKPKSFDMDSIKGRVQCLPHAGLGVGAYPHALQWLNISSRFVLRGVVLKLSSVDSAGVAYRQTVRSPTSCLCRSCP